MTSTPELRKRFHVTVYQQGWRLGGKGASGRGPGRRIEEHGLHMWMGWYEHAFRLLQRCYAERTPEESRVFPHWRDAFAAVHTVTLEELLPGGRHGLWNLTFPPAPGEPGEGSDWRVGDAIVDLLAWISRTGRALLTVAHTDDSMFPDPLRVLDAIRGGVFDALDELIALIRGHADGWSAALGKLLVVALDAIQGVLARVDGALRRTGLLVRLAVAGARGTIAEVLPRGDFAALDGEDLRAWLARHGADAPELQDAAPLRALYDLIFAYPGGVAGRAHARVAAGAALKMVLRLLFTYREAPLWTMRAGMGDTVFAPLYQVLARRGVRFEFFRRVHGLDVGLDEDGREVVDRVEIGVQAEVRGAYAPLTTVKGTMCWPDAPDWEQLVDGVALAADGAAFESAWCATEQRREVLRRGDDFDAVVLAIPVGALPGITQPLADRSPRWRAMLGHSHTVATRAMQLWLRPRSGGPYGLTSVLSGGPPPWSSCADMSAVLEHEDWPGERGPASVHYFCDVFPDTGPDGPPLTDPGYPARAVEQVFAGAEPWLAAHLERRWPGTTADGQVRWDLLVADDWRFGVDRLRAQYFRANVDPSERYVLTLPGTPQHRLAPGDSGFANLMLAGDWTATSINGGSVEAAAESGVLAAAALRAMYAPGSPGVD